MTFKVPADHVEELNKNRLANRIRMRFIRKSYDCDGRKTTACVCVGGASFQAPNINTSKPTLCSFVTVRMRYVDEMMYPSTED
jgi:hypothetical protein